jgi:hypothetical protein
VIACLLPRSQRLISGRGSRQEGKKEKKLIIRREGGGKRGRSAQGRKEGSSDGFLGHFSLLLSHCPCGFLARQSLLQQRQIH